MHALQSTSLLDILAMPCIENFIFAQALRLNEAEFLDGARHAVAAVNHARRTAVRGDERYMEALDRSHSLAPALQTILQNEARRVCSDALGSKAALEQLSEEQSCLDAGSMDLTHTHLVVGAMRDYFPQSAEGYYMLSLGSHLSVCGREKHNLWSIDTQGRLLEDEGCSIRLTVHVGRGAETSDAETNEYGYVFEAAVDGAMILDQPGHNELHFQLVDIQGRTNGDAFWSRAVRVGVLDTLCFWKASSST